MKKTSTAEKAFKKQLILASLLFAVFFVSILSTGAYIIIKDLGEKEVFRLLDHYRKDLETMTTNIPETETAKGFKYEKVVTTRINQFMVDKKIFDSFELYDSEGKMIDRQDYLKGGQVQFYDFPNSQNPPLGQARVEIRNKVPIAVNVQIAPGKMGRAVLNVSDKVLQKQAQAFRSEMILKFSVLLSLIFFMLFVSYLYVLRLLRVSRTIQEDSQEQSRLSYLGLLSSGLAHEIKNPLNGLKLNIQLLEEGIRTDADKQELIASVEPMLNQIKRLEKLTRDFLMYARPLDPEFKQVNAKDIIEDLLLSFSEQARDKKVTVELNIKGTEKEIPADENMLRIALSNLLLNAIQASPADEVVAVNLAFLESELLVEFIDRGGGIQEENKERIYDIFFTTKAEGTGLGLSIVKKLVEIHNGRIEFVPEEKGAHFKVSFPYFH